MTTDRLALVRSAYERYNDRDLDGVLELLDPHVSWPDVVNGTVMVGREAVRRCWQGHFDVASPTVVPEDLYEVGDAVIAIVRQQVEDHDGKAIGPSSIAAHKLTFRGELVTRMEITVETFPDEIQAVFRPRLRQRAPQRGTSMMSAPAPGGSLTWPGLGANGPARREMGLGAWAAWVQERRSPLRIGDPASRGALRPGTSSDLAPDLTMTSTSRRDGGPMTPRRATPSAQLPVTPPCAARSLSSMTNKTSATRSPPSCKPTASP
jgi:hypothetical protein